MLRVTPPHVAGGRGGRCRPARPRRSGAGARCCNCAFEEEAGSARRPGWVWSQVRGLPAVARGRCSTRRTRQGARALRGRQATGAALVARCFRDGSFMWAGAADLCPLPRRLPAPRRRRPPEQLQVEIRPRLDGALAEVALSRRRRPSPAGATAPPPPRGRSVPKLRPSQENASVAAVDACHFARDALRRRATSSGTSARWRWRRGTVPTGSTTSSPPGAAGGVQALETQERAPCGVRRACSPTHSNSAKRTAKEQEAQNDGSAIDSVMVLSATRMHRATTPKRTRTAGQDDGTLLRRRRLSMVFSAANRTMTKCARAAAAAAEDAAFMRRRCSAATQQWTTTRPPRKGLDAAEPGTGLTRPLATPAAEGLRPVECRLPNLRPRRAHRHHDDYQKPPWMPPPR
ncbi:hypothetical protein ZWY2020_037400 [Hordeum vulgare]|nr:hypothetical protein ZWY2020_037400 [Hordeum vulgare]